MEDHGHAAVGVIADALMATSEPPHRSPADTASTIPSARRLASGTRTRPATVARPM